MKERKSLVVREIRTRTARAAVVYGLRFRNIQKYTSVKNVRDKKTNEKE